MKTSRRSILVDAQRWATYAVVGAATAGAASEQVRGDIIYSGMLTEPVSQARLRLASGTTLIRGGTFRFFTDHNWYTLVNLSAYPLDATFAAFRRSFLTYLSNLGPNVALSTVVPYEPYLWGGVVSGRGGLFGSGFAGLRFDVGDGTQFAWLRVNSGYVVDWAYGTPGQPLLTGQTAVPESGSLGLLALGASGLLAWRAARAQRKSVSLRSGNSADVL